ncbi:MAG: hypothetical protein M3N15_05695 [Actinomycetota bacterium]|nr:hypothetical protein [Actinomycetota bacterium]
MTPTLTVSSLPEEQETNDAPDQVTPATEIPAPPATRRNRRRDSARAVMWI